MKLEREGQTAEDFGFFLSVKEAASGLVVEEWHMVVYIVRGSLAASRQVACWTAVWQRGSSQVLSHGTGGRRWQLS